MKRFAILVAVVALIGCTQNDKELDNIANIPSKSPTEFYASMPECDTRTYVEDNKYLRWNAGDEITIFNGNSYNSHWQFAGEDGANSGKFNEVEEGGFVTGSPLNLTANYAIYPYDENITITESGVVLLTLPAVQEYNHTYANSFGAGANTMMAVTKNTSDNFLSFKNLCGYLKLKFYGDDVTVKSVIVKGNNGEKIAGKATVSMTYGGEPTITMGNDATDTITIDCGEGVALSSDYENPTIFWVVVPEITFEGGITITVTDTNDQTFTKTTTNAVPIVNNMIQPMATLGAEFGPTATPETWKIYYTAEAKIDPNYNRFNANIVSNEYDSTTGIGVITFDNELTTIGTKSFYFSHFTSITLPSSLISIGESAFQNSSKLTSVTILGNNLKTISNKAFSDCSKLVSINIPSSVSSIGTQAFYYCVALKNIELPSNLKEVGAGVFTYCCELVSITIPEGVESVNANAFANCTKLQSITIPNSVESIGGSAFMSTGIESLTLGNNVKTIESYAFATCKNLTSVTTPTSVTFIGERAFSNSGLVSANIYGSECVISKSAFYGDSSLKDVVINEGVISIDDDAFYGCNSLENIKIAESVTTISGYPFYGCDALPILDNIRYADTYLIGVTDDGASSTYKIKEGTRFIKNNAFYDCSALSSIIIPESVISIGAAFQYCPSLSKVYCNATTPPVGANQMFYYTAKDLTIYVPSASVAAYKEAQYWSSLNIVAANNRIVYTNSTKAKLYITNGFGANFVSHSWDSATNKGVILFDGDVITIPENAFKEEYLDAIELPESLTRIEYGAFKENDFTEITIPASVTYIGTYAFMYCENMISCYCKPIVPPSGSTAASIFVGYRSNFKIYVPRQSETAYEDNWNFNAGRVEPYDFE